MECASCGFKVIETDIYCPNCGKAVNLKTDSKDVHRCVWCGHQSFKTDKSSLDKGRGLTEHELVLRICENCGFVHYFLEGDIPQELD